MYKGVQYNEQDFKFFDGYRFDSFEEMLVYRYIKSLGLKIEKLCKKDKLYNPLYDEYYIPDFILEGHIYVEYYGLWRRSDSSLFDYNEKTTRKNEFYTDSGFNFIPIYPDDIKDNFKNLNYKLVKEIHNNRGINLPLKGVK